MAKKEQTDMHGDSDLSQTSGSFIKIKNDLKQLLESMLPHEKSKLFEELNIIFNFKLAHKMQTVIHEEPRHEPVQKRSKNQGHKFNLISNHAITKIPSSPIPHSTSIPILSASQTTTTYKSPTKCHKQTTINVSFFSMAQSSDRSKSAGVLETTMDLRPGREPTTKIQNEVLSKSLHRCHLRYQ
ncbi:hypothetical protein HYC85_014863 [Camellia sinensis]|uniref:Uncharacterized protein n=1 Tax=Camellia sinensis TaxID=4442 RepID=A0A7J7HAV8_CAMSI|nr:hypothetical protein HYC85_014863 [Camellia sinensis]